ncbi:type IX secretion system plug protein [Sediminitomix flava]|uniref:Uncharacterized protein DUF5103 n=1 Tax=Sediminitomix flava TaxID=379075 RepID=A0A315ZFK0_SEDFL|nr:DUF5103 domain-containing protein [Sediminitomix flava]PWJ44281.1 uncharacterized protein DUF5103 [Sediminitomix flava]
MRAFLPLLLIVFAFSDAWAQFNYKDEVYDDEIATVLFYSTIHNQNGQTLSPPILPLNSSGKLILEFDQFGDDAPYYKAKIIHCDHEWNPSRLNPIEFIQGFQDQNINDFEFSLGTKVPYVNFKLELPKVKISGNYIIKVYPRGDERNVVLTRRFVVYESITQVGIQARQTVGGQLSQELQEVNVTVSYNEADLNILPNNVWITIRQNMRWDNARYSIMPRFNKVFDKLLDFTFSDYRNAFDGGNEFRGFTTNTENARGGLRVGNFEINRDFNKMFLYPDLQRGNLTYNQSQQDINGQFFVTVANRDPRTQADYTEVIFTLKADRPLDGELYIQGAFSDWDLKEDYKMHHVSDKNAYLGSAFLKQGVYNYQYVLKKADGSYSSEPIENSFRITENAYDVFVYYRDMGGRYDRVIGYKMVNSRGKF